MIAIVVALLLVRQLRANGGERAEFVDLLVYGHSGSISSLTSWVQRAEEHIPVAVLGHTIYRDIDDPQRQHGYAILVTFKTERRSRFGVILRGVSSPCESRPLNISLTTKQFGVRAVALVGYAPMPSYVTIVCPLDPGPFATTFTARRLIIAYGGFFNDADGLTFPASTAAKLSRPIANSIAAMSGLSLQPQVRFGFDRLAALSAGTMRLVGGTADGTFIAKYGDVGDVERIATAPTTLPAPGSSLSTLSITWEDSERASVRDLYNTVIGALFAIAATLIVEWLRSVLRRKSSQSDPVVTEQERLITRIKPLRLDFLRLGLTALNFCCFNCGVLILAAVAIVALMSQLGMI